MPNKKNKSQNSWPNLSPAMLLNELEKTLHIHCSNLCIPRNSYINRVFECEYANSNERFIVKLYRPDRWTKQQIEQEHTILHHLFQNDIPVIPPLTFHNQTLFKYEHCHVAIFPKKWGRHLTELNKDQWTELGRLLGRSHQVLAQETNINRQSWEPAKVTKKHLRTICNEHVLPPNYEQPLINAVEQFINVAQPLFEDQYSHLIHGDCHLGNIIYRPEESLYLVDFDDMIIGPPVQDLWLFLPDTMKNSHQEFNWLMEGYTVFADLPQSSLELIPYLKCMRQIHFAAWCAIQTKEPHFNHHFPAWGDVKYWNALIKSINETKNITYSS